MDNALALVIEDEPEIGEILQAYFERAGWRVVWARDGRIGLDHHRALRPDLVVLDVRLPKADGFEVLAAIRRTSDTPVIMATAVAEDADKLSALRMGADDYVVKPFNPQEVVARAQAVLRRTSGRAEGRALRAGPIEVDLSAHAARVGDGPPLDLTLTEFRLLAHMARSPARAFQRSELMDACLQESEALERTLDSHVSNLRRKLRAAGAEGFLESVRGVGYRLAPL